jgi:hypothetical protein
MKKVIIILSVFCVSLSGDFVQRWIIPDGKNSYGRVLIGEINYNGLIDIVVRRNQPIKVMFYELDISNQWQLQDSIVDDGDHLLWAFGDFDLDGFSDIVFQKTFGIPNVGIAIYESPDSFSYPTQEVWRDTVGFPLVQPISAYDVDNDGYPEILDNNGDAPNFFWIYESVGNNQYDLIFTDNPDTSNNDAPSSTHGFGDFDSDGKIEFVMGGMSAGSLGATYWIYESPADNTYERIVQGYVSTKNIKDCFSIPDADEDGKMEFVVKGFVIPSAEIHAFIFEAIGDNTYEIIKTFTLPGGDYYGGYSDAGDVDGDSIPEIVLEARQNVFIIKAAGNDSFYIWDTLPGNGSGSSIAVYDIDENGLAEIIISGNDETRIYEYDPGGIVEARSKIYDAGLEVFPNPFSKILNIRHSIEVDEMLQIKIYDVSGCLVKAFDDLVDQTFKQITWDGTDSIGQQVPRGIYFVRLETPDESMTRKIVKLK